ncbi:uncharacterized protein LOC114760767 [Neltuma alba]|uniref:uncharacterized protein LOC114760767 n=1 Tax=Neltuma alba TaxID=207710 RepID=UPI0010A3D180|nr:uncharacterized protein LOC114760767 [Prosopis alba]
MILLVVYVDDIVITGSNGSGISSLKSFLNSHFQMKDLGSLTYFLGIEVMRSKKGILLTQRKYVLDLLKETGKLGAAPTKFPMVHNPLLDADGSIPLDDSLDDEKQMLEAQKSKPFENPERYRRMIGKLNYLTVTRPDITYPVSVLSQFMASLTIRQWEALEHVLHYLKGCPGRGILYKNHGHTDIECFCDADHGGSKATRRSTTGYCVFVGGNLVSWKSKKQNVVSRSSAEAEYRAMAQSVCEIIWIYQLLKEVGLKTTLPAKLWCDNKAALHIASNSVFHERTKHIEIDCHFIRDKLKENFISTGYVRSSDQLGDLLTKALNGTRVDYLCDKLGMLNIYAPT